MNKVRVNCELDLEFEDGAGRYSLRNPGCGNGFNVVRTTSLLGKAIFGKKEGEAVEFFNSQGELVKVRIVKVVTHRSVYNTL